MGGSENSFRSPSPRCSPRRWRSAGIRGCRASSPRTRSVAGLLVVPREPGPVGHRGARRGITAFYMFRLVFLTFFGESRMDPEVEKHAHESPWTMTAPLTILAVLSVAGGWIGIPAVWARQQPLRSIGWRRSSTPSQRGRPRAAAPERTRRRERFITRGARARPDGAVGRDRPVRHRPRLLPVPGSHREAGGDRCKVARPSTTSCTTSTTSTSSTSGR